MSSQPKVTIKNAEALLLILILTGPFAAATCFAVDVYLAAQPFTYQNSNPAASYYSPTLGGITMWGYILTDNTFTPLPGEAVKVPGPTLTVTEGQTLNIHVRNNLPAAGPGVFTEPTSIIIPGQTAALSPVWVNPGTGATFTGSRPAGDVVSRVRSLTQETPVGGTQTYTWTAVKAGTYLYQSGTHPALQVQMGLYGPFIVNSATPNQAYDNASTAYDSQVTLVFSEIDPELHYSVASGLYGTPPPAPPAPALRGQRTSAEDYHPKYFLINGAPFTYGVSPIPAGNPGRVLFRFLNAGLLEKSPTLQTQGLFMTLIGEDGNLLTNFKQQYSLLLPAGKTMDALITPPSAGYIALYDRGLNLTNAATSPGGMLRYLQVTDPTQVTLTVNRIGVGAVVGAGTVQATSLPAGIDCGTGGLVCTQSYNPGVVIKLTAAAKNGSRFTGWIGACTGTQADCILPPLAANTAVTAAFSPTLIGVFRDGQWFKDLNRTGAWEGCGTDGCVSPFGMAGDLPVIGDWDGTGTTKIGVFRNGQWFLDLNGNGVWDGCGTDACYASFGQAGDLPVAGDWTGTGATKIGVFRNGQWFLDLNGNGVWDGCGTDGCYASFGQAGDVPVVGDWTGTGTMKIGVFRNGQWFLDLNGNGVWDGCGTDGCYASFGRAGDLPVAGDWTGTGTMKIGVFRNGQWFLDLNGNGVWDGCGTDACYASFGAATDKPVAGAW
jgi:FtsP/CotA-like multicopper oxidase with cupredoxin domain